MTNQHADGGRPESGRPPLTLRIVRGVVTVAAAAAVLALTALALAPTFGVRAMAVTSGSMAPALQVGDAVLVQEVAAETVRAGDVITYAGYGATGFTTHRVIDTSHVSDVLHFRTQGDANDAPDPNLAPAAGLAGRVVGRVPAGGRVLLRMHDPSWRLILLGGPALLLTLRYAAGLVTSRTPSPATDPAHGRGLSQPSRSAPSPTAPPPVPSAATSPRLTVARVRTGAKPLVLILLTAGLLVRPASPPTTDARFVATAPVGDNTISTSEQF